MREIKINYIMMVVLFAWTFSLAGRPMESASQTLYVMVHGINPDEYGLEKLKCPEYAGVGGSAWAMKGITRYLNDQVLNSEHGSYTQTFLRPSSSPIDLFHELADRTRDYTELSCTDDRPYVSTTYNPESNKLVKYGSEKNSEWRFSNFFDKALETWFEQELVEAQILEGSKQLPLEQKRRNFNEVSFGIDEKFQDSDIYAELKTKKHTEEYSVFASNGNPRLTEFIRSFKENEDRYPELSEVKNSRPDLLPLRYVVLAHSMGGLVAREYIQSDMYLNDIDKLILFDSPQQGSGSADAGLFLSNNVSTGAIFEANDIKNESLDILTLILIDKMAEKLIVSHPWLGKLMEKLIAEEVQNGYFNSANVFDEFLSPENAKNVGNFVDKTDNFFSIMARITGMPQEYDVKKAGGLWYLSVDDYGVDPAGVLLADAGGNAAKDNIGKLKKLNNEQAPLGQINPMVRIYHHDGLPSFDGSRRLDDRYVRAAGLIKSPFNVLYSILPTSKLRKDFLDIYWQLMIDSGADKMANRTYNHHGTLLKYLGININERGTNAVPSWSSKAMNVSYFNSSNVDTRRIKYLISPKNIIDSDREYYHYTKTAAESGSMFLVYDVLAGVKTLCKLTASKFGIDKSVCSTISAVSMIPLALSWGKDIVGASTDGIIPIFTALDNSSHDFSQIESWRQTTQAQLSFNSLISEKQEEIKKTDLEDFIYEAPYVSIKTIVEEEDGGEKKIYPLLLYKTTESKAVGQPGTSDFPSEIVNSSNLNGNKDDVSNGEEELEASGPLFVSRKSIENRKIDFSSKAWNLKLPLKMLSFREEEGVNNPVIRDVEYFDTPPMIISGFIREYRFQIDDVRPDLFRQIKVNFNFKMEYVWERIMSGDLTQCARFKRAGTSGDYERLEDAACPINRNGEFIIRPEEDGLLVGNTLTAIQEDGPNVVSVMVTNKVGMGSNQQFSYIFKAASDIIAVEWPKSGNTISSLDDIELLVSNWAYPEGLSSATVRLNKQDLNLTQVLEATELDEVESESFSSDDGEGYDTHWWMKLNNIDDSQIDDGQYTATFNTTLYNLADDTQTFDESVISRFNLDRTNPEFDLEFSGIFPSEKPDEFEEELINIKSFSDSYGAPIYMTIDENAPDQSLWMTGVNIACNDGDIIKSWEGLIPKVSSNRVQIPVKISDLAEGMCDFTIWGVDDAVADKQSLDFRNTVFAWDVDDYNKFGIPEKNSFYARVKEGLFNSDGDTFKNGVNGSVVKKKFIVDRTSPEISTDEESGFVLSKISSKINDYPTITSDVFEEELVLNSYEKLKVNFSIKDKSFGRLETSATLEVYLKNAEGDLVNTLVWNGILDEAEGVWLTAIGEIEESETNLLKDGLYSIEYTIKDETGNKSEIYTYPGKIRIDRTAPEIRSVYAFMEYKTVSEIDNATAYISQDGDLLENKTQLYCYKKLWAGGKESDWIKSIDDDLTRITEGSQTVYYDLKTDYAEDGIWVTGFGCLDEAGNFAFNTDQLHVGNKYPQIVEPTGVAGELIENSNVLIKGVAQNPEFSGDDNNVQYRLRWKNTNDNTDTWRSEGMDVGSATRLSDDQKNISLMAANVLSDLGVWDRSNLANGVYEIELSVKGCEACDWVSTIKTVMLHDIETENEVQLSVVLPENLTPGESDNNFKLKLDNGSLESEYSATLVIRTPNPSGSGEIVSYTTAKEDIFVSPYLRKNEQDIDVSADGFHIWQDEDETWNIAVRNANSIKEESEKTTPKVVLGFTSTPNWITTPIDIKTQEISKVVDFPSIEALDVAQELLPIYEVNRYDTLSMVDLNEAYSIYQFKHSGAFQVNVFELGVEKNWIGGLKQNTFRNSPMTSANIVFSYNPEYYNWNVNWNGISRSGKYSYPGVGKAEWIVVDKATSGVNRIEKSFNILPAPLTLVTEQKSPGQFIVGVDSNSEETFTLGKVGLKYGMLGANANISAKIFSESIGLIRTLKTNEYTEAGTSLTRLSLSWDGVDNDGFAVTDPGNYYFEITAVGEDGQTSSLSYPFELKLSEGLVEAPNDITGNGAELSIDETVDINGITVLTPQPNYLVKADVTAKFLPPELRTIKYQYDYKGKQSVKGYKPQRFALGIRRYRPEFDVTVVAALVVDGGDITSYPECGLNAQTILTFKKKKISFKNLTSGSLLKVLDLEKQKDGGYIGFYASNNAELGDGEVGNVKNFKIFPYTVYLKVFTGDAYDAIDLDGLSTEITELDYTLDDRTNHSNLKDVLDAPVKRFFQDSYGQARLWSGSVNFKQDDSRDIIPMYSDIGVPNKCPSDADFDGDVCDSDESSDDALQDFNPHKDMLDINVLKAPEEDSWSWGSYGGKCKEHKKSNKYAGVRLELSVKSDYWNPINFGSNNLANRYLRFDPTNITLYYDQGYFNVLTDPKNSNLDELKNYYDGESWKSSINYGYATPFEAQSFEMREVVENPLLFADEIKTDSEGNIVSNFENLYPGMIYARFFLPSDFESYNWNAVIEGKTKLCVNNKFIDKLGCVESGDFFNVSRNNKYIKINSLKDDDANGYIRLNPNSDYGGIDPSTLKITVAPFSTIDAGSDELPELISSPANINWDKNIEVCDDYANPNWKNIESNDGLKVNCYKIYKNASEVHYFPFDFSLNDLNEKLGKNINDVYIINNPVVASNWRNPPSSFSSILNLNDVSWLVGSDNMDKIGNSLDATKHEFPIDPADLDWSDSKVSIDKAKLELSEVDENLNLSDAIVTTVAENWTINENSDLEASLVDFPVKDDPVLQHDHNTDGDIDYFGMIFDTKLSNQNLSDTDLIPGSSKSYSIYDLYKQSEDNKTLDEDNNWSNRLYIAGEINPWVNNISMSNTGVFNTNLDNHDYFEIENLENNIVNIKRTLLPEEERAKEIVSIRGRVPGMDQEWGLYYLRNGVLENINSGVFPGVLDDQKQPLLSYFDVNKLQGNTTFFLTYGESANTPLFFKKLNLEVGKKLDLDADNLVQSLYRDVSIEFKPGSYQDETYVTVRNVSPEEYNMSSFNGLDPVGPVIEVLPSSDFSHLPLEDRPRVKVRLTRESLSGQDLTKLRIYKPDFENETLVPLEKQQMLFLDESGEPLGNVCLENEFGSMVYVPEEESESIVCVPEIGWKFVQISAITSSFSEFAVLNFNSVENSKASMNVIPNISNQLDRIVSYNSAFAFDIYVDDDSLWFDASDNTKPVKLVSSDLGEGELSIVLPEQTISYIYLVPSSNEENIYVPNVVKVEYYPDDIQCELADNTEKWFGIDNGNLEVDLVCNNPSIADMEIREGNYPIAKLSNYELTENGIVWTSNDAKTPIYSENPYVGRIQISDVLSNTTHIFLPEVYTDPERPTLENFELQLSDINGGKQVTITGIAKDTYSELKSLEFTLSLGQNILKSDTLTVFETNEINWSYVLDINTLEICQGCRLNIDVVAKDKGNNWSSTELSVTKVFSLAEGLVFWYPLSEMIGNQANEITGNGENLELNIHSPWVFGSGLYFSKNSDQAQPIDSKKSFLPESDSYSFEFTYRPGYSFNDEKNLLMQWTGDEGFKCFVKNRDLIIEHLGSVYEFKDILTPEKVWGHFIVSFNESNIQIHKNGILTAQLPLTSMQISGMGQIKLGSDSQSNSAKGELTDLRVYKNALSDIQIKNILWKTPNPDDVKILRVADMNIDGDILILQSCDIPGQNYIKKGSNDGSVGSSISLEAGLYRVFILAKASYPLPSKVKLNINGSNVVEQEIPNTNLWESLVVADYWYDHNGGVVDVNITPIGGVGIAAISFIKDHSIDAISMNWGGADWAPPQDEIEVSAMLNNADSKWMKANVKLKNIGFRDISGLKLRYNFIGEPWEEVLTQSFYPSNIQINVYGENLDDGYAELDFGTTSLSPGQKLYNGQEIQFGLYRSNWYEWDVSDDPSWDLDASSAWKITDRFQVIDDSGKKVAGSCIESGPEKLRYPEPVIYAYDSKYGSSQSSSIYFYIENRGNEAIEGLYVEYYAQLPLGIEMQLSPMYNPHGSAVTKEHLGGGLWKVQVPLTELTLAPGDKSLNGQYMQFEIYYPNWATGWDAADDPSYLTSQSKLANGMVLKDINGNVLWGNIPNTPTSNPSNSNGYIVIKDGMLEITPPIAGNYSVEVINAAGIRQNTIFNGWMDSKRTFDLPTLSVGEYIVLKLNSAIIDQL